MEGLALPPATVGAPKRPAVGTLLFTSSSLAGEFVGDSGLRQGRVQWISAEDAYDTTRTARLTRAGPAAGGGGTIPRTTGARRGSLTGGAARRKHALRRRDSSPDDDGGAGRPLRGRGDRNGRLDSSEEEEDGQSWTPVVGLGGEPGEGTRSRRGGWDSGDDVRRPERRRHDSSDEDDDGSDSVDATTFSGHGSGLKNAGNFAVAERKPRKRQHRELEKYNAKNGGDGRTVYRDKSGRRREVDPAADETERPGLRGRRRRGSQSVQRLFRLERRRRVDRRARMAFPYIDRGRRKWGPDLVCSIHHPTASQAREHCIASKPEVRWATSNSKYNSPWTATPVCMSTDEVVVDVSLRYQEPRLSLRRETTRQQFGTARLPTMAPVLTNFSLASLLVLPMTALSFSVNKPLGRISTRSILTHTRRLESNSNDDFDFDDFEADFEAGFRARTRRKKEDFLVPKYLANEEREDNWAQKSVVSLSVILALIVATSFASHSFFEWFGADTPDPQYEPDELVVAPMQKGPIKVDLKDLLDYN
ncbi:hypothetical protein THAOC_19117 [Thalassiosira oceanica]|uniref:Transmembrane protein n=1 Tax=Thalassiosira oceanica TaxID=159749 RepID=K0S6H3_THAOC|nr:hypothetical protein THAOC_19117 [Thalassiosira oceanica]|eukprot:EJK60509.1 hypothetical protein THAOC_19117 [Thalassiosira oceanica]